MDEPKVTETLTPAQVPTAEDSRTVSDNGTANGTTTDGPTFAETNVDPDAVWNRTLDLVDVNATRPNVTVEDRTFEDELPQFVVALTSANRDDRTSQPAGYPPSERRVVVSARAVRNLSASSLERVLVHNYAHAIQDQHTWFVPFQRDPDVAPVGGLTRTVYYEGIATFLEREYAERHFGSRVGQDLVDRYENASTAGRYLLAPKRFGVQYVERRVERTGNLSALATDPPVSSEQLLHDPNAPRRNLTVDFESPDGWTLAPPFPQGELATRIVLRDELSRERAIAAADGWGAGWLYEFESPTHDRPGFVWVQRWDSVPDADEFQSAIETYLDHRRSAEPDYEYDSRRLTDETTAVLVTPGRMQDHVTVAASSNESVRIVVED